MLAWRAMGAMLRVVARVRWCVRGEALLTGRASGVDKLGRSQ
jgi:hypothetical protein